mmetsp:Transcript_3071/g.5695  ORF Transcript_3071/g.5695 Transcript_3071/m.5695 type:complete len:193 (+) Transcript_3071:72-650(+)|eukprot:CAMPEP_0197525950 /NCGR_PEP_ID=MMETSP1318-20131121/15318_1 /TAXON_ID=552666 /ORGANISM="Partenskyella glossopodia, Strain RCC365" /LENGTH=192 /DNA_ID=CAMNT_0043079811 /DNA_START=44 /DNA_END=622 /DNA_ORIENTATION=+
MHMQAKIYNYLLFAGLSFAVIGFAARSGLGREKLGVGVAARARMPSLRVAKSAGMLMRAGGNVLPGVTASRQILKCRAAGEITEINKEDYYSSIKEAGDKLVMVDFFTDWCGPCKMILPFLEELQRDNKDNLQIYKMNCAGENRDLVNELGVRVLPTFMFYKGEQNVATIKGAKRDDLKATIAEHIAVSSKA